jgi:hypothetical protein
VNPPTSKKHYFTVSSYETTYGDNLIDEIKTIYIKPKEMNG